MNDQPTHAGTWLNLATCGDTTFGRHQTNVARYPENWSQVTCKDCISKK